MGGEGIGMDSTDSAPPAETGTRELAPEKIMKIWVTEWTNEGVAIDLKKLLPPKDSGTFLPRRWIVERTF